MLMKYEAPGIKNPRNQLPDCAELGLFCPPGKAQDRFGARSGAHGASPDLRIEEPADVFLQCDGSRGRSCSPVRALWRPAGFRPKPAGRLFGKMQACQR